MTTAPASEQRAPSRLRLLGAGLIDLACFVLIFVLACIGFGFWHRSSTTPRQQRQDLWRFEEAPANDRAVVGWARSAGLQDFAVHRVGATGQIILWYDTRPQPAIPNWNSLGYKGARLVASNVVVRRPDSFSTETLLTSTLGWLAILVSEVFAAAIILWRLHRTRRRSPAMIVPSTRPHPNWWKPLVLAGIAISLLVAATELAIRAFRLQEAAKHPLDDLVPRLNAWPAAMLFAVVVIAAPVTEEWLFRGGLFGRFRAHGYAASGAILSALAFALAHCIPVLIPYYFCCGLILAWLCHRTGSLWPPVALHATMNSIYFAVTRL